MIDEEGRGDETVRSGVLGDWDLCKYKEHMGMDKKPRQPVVMVRSACQSRLYAHSDKYTSPLVRVGYMVLPLSAVPRLSTEALHTL